LVIIGAKSYGFCSRLDAGLSGNHDDRALHTFFFGFLENVGAGIATQDDVGEDQIEITFGNELQSGGIVFSGLNLIPFLGKE
jgi:hypothetical protein